MDPARSVSENHVKLPAHRAGLPGKEVVSFFIAPLIPAYNAGLTSCTPG
jgi:hypothetical protein